MTTLTPLAPQTGRAGRRVRRWEYSLRTGLVVRHQDGSSVPSALAYRELLRLLKLGWLGEVEESEEYLSWPLRAAKKVL